MGKTLIGIVVGIAIGAFGYWALGSGSLSGLNLPMGNASARPQNSISKDAPVGTFCAKIITPARDPKTGTIQEFPSSCSVPEGWEPVTNDVPGLDLEVQ
jgi:hypothetical protein